MEQHTFKRMEEYDKEFLMRAYDALTSDNYRRYILPLIYARIMELENRIVAEDEMDEQRREARKELINITNMAVRVKEILSGS